MKAIVLLLCLAGVAAATPNPRLAVGLDEHVGDRVPRGLVFTDSTGRTVALGSLIDGKRPVVLVLAYARCSMLCSVVLRGVAEAVRTSELAAGRDYLPVVVSLDSRETPDEAARRQNRLLEDIGRADRDVWPYLVGDEASVAALARVLGFHYAWDPKTEQYAHPAVIFVLTPDGRIAEYLHGISYDGLASAVSRAARGVLTTAVARDLLSCFRFDPSLRHYESDIALLYRLGALLVLLALIALITALVLWERRHGAP